MDDRTARLSFRFPAAFSEFPREGFAESIPDHFERQVRLRPDAVAVRCGSAELTYEQLNQAANRAARHLLEHVPEGPAPVALLLDQELSLVVWIVSVMNAGLAYVPLDRRQPVPALERLI
jgi:non-ribosomal peptide synthetase component F